MLALTDPNEAYRRSLFDARVQGATLPLWCSCVWNTPFLASAEHCFAHQRGDTAARSKALNRALTAITALEMDVDRSAPLADALLQMYGAARHAVLGSVTDFKPDLLGSVRQDLVEIETALRSSD